MSTIIVEKTGFKNVVLSGKPLLCKGVAIYFARQDETSYNFHPELHCKEGCEDCPGATPKSEIKSISHISLAFRMKNEQPVCVHSYYNDKPQCYDRAITKCVEMGSENTKEP